MTPPPRPRRSLASWLDLGHVEVLLWDPPAPPESHAFSLSPLTAWRILLSTFWPQRARVIRLRGFPGRESYWKTWEPERSGFDAVASYLEDLRESCLRGRARYRAISFNCFHVAYRCLELAGVDPPGAARQWVLVVPTLGSKSFQRSVMRGVASSRMADHLPESLRSQSSGSR